MIIKFRKLVWTQHSEIKMKQYGLSKSKLSNIIRRPERKEKGIVPGTTAVMKTNPTSLKLRGASKTGQTWKPQRAPGEIWLMYKDVNKKNSSNGTKEAVRRVISAWRYPGITKPGDAIPIPEDIREELLNEE
jgi:hypothetical protein